MFGLDHRESVENFLNDLKNVKEDSLLPTVVTVKAVESKYQTVKWSVPRPRVNQKLNIIMDGKKIEAEVTDVETNNNIIDTIHVKSSDGNPKIVIVNGKWQICGLNSPHTIKFIW